MKKLLLSLGSVAAAIAPVTAVIACGDKTSKSDDVVSKIGLKLGKQDANDGIVLTFTADTNQKIAAGSYYFTKKELEVGKTITVKSTDAGKTTTLKVKTAAITAAASDVKAQLETTEATPADVTNTVVAALGDPAKFTATEGDITKTVDNNAGIVAAIAAALEAKTPEALFEDSYTNKAALKNTINKVLASIDKKLGSNAITLAKPSITSISNLVAGAVDADTDVDTFGLAFGKQDANDGIVLTFTADTNQKIAAGSYYFTKKELEVGKTITVKSTDAGKTTTLKVKTTAIAAATSDVKAQLETTEATPADVTNTVVAVLGTSGEFFETKDGISKEIAASNVTNEIKILFDSVLKTKYLTKEDLTKSIDQLLIAFDQKLNENGTSLGYAGPTITIANTLVDVETEA